MDMEKLRQVLLPNTYEIIVQDQAKIIQKATNSSLRFMPHDFFREQPVQHARAYFLRSVLHNWSDDRACDVLRALRPAMARGYSKLMLCENVTPELGAPLMVAALDITMMGLMCGQARTETDWRRLLNAAGFALCVIQADVADNE